jgi:hypothetical protein
MRLFAFCQQPVLLKGPLHRKALLAFAGFGIDPNPPLIGFDRAVIAAASRIGVAGFKGLAAAFANVLVAPGHHIASHGFITSCTWKQYSAMLI